MTLARVRAVFETRVRRYRGSVVAWGVWRVPAAPRSPRIRQEDDEPAAVAEFYGLDAQGRATQYAKQLAKEG
jgi:hypothetical protein